MQLVLTEQRWVRMSAFTAFYFAQGVPIGFLTVALLKWLDGSISELATYGAIVTLPWAFKLVVGPFMDRFTYRSMGFRRPWVLVAQGGLLAGFIVMAFTDSSNLVMVTAVGFLINSFAATQDVAVDGMAIDVLPVEERGRANALMGFGQASGSAAFGALCLILLPVYGLRVTSFICAIVIALIFVIVAIVRERPGERLMPWTEGVAAVIGRQAVPSIVSNFSDLIKVLIMPMSLLVTFFVFLSRMGDGIIGVVLPVLADTRLGIADSDYGTVMGIASLTGALIGAACGVYIDRFGAKRFLLFGLIGSGFANLLFALTSEYWSSMDYVVIMLFVAKILGQFVFISMIALYMNMCWTKVSATQFAVYMSLLNLGMSAGSGVLAALPNDISFETNFVIVSCLLFITAIGMFFYSQESHRLRIEALD